MRLLTAALLLTGCYILVAAGGGLDDGGLLEDNEFAEFEQFDADEDLAAGIPSQQQQPQPPQFINVDDGDDDILVEVGIFVFFFSINAPKISIANRQNIKMNSLTIF